jgi:translation initiation factor IF-3
LKRYQQKNKLHPKNAEITVPFVTLVTSDGERIEQCETKRALQMAYDDGLDLILVAPSATPPVARIMDWGKYKYEQQKKDEQNKKTKKNLEIKEIRLRPQTGQHDLEIKINKVKEFLEKGHKVKITMMFRGREVAYLDKGKQSLNNLINQLADISKPDDRLTFQFKKLSVTLSPVKPEVSK